MILKSDANSTEITFVKKKSFKDHDSTYVNLKEHDEGAAYRNQYGTKYSYFSQSAYKYKPKGYSSDYKKKKYMYSYKKRSYDGRADKTAGENQRQVAKYSYDPYKKQEQQEKDKR